MKIESKKRALDKIYKRRDRYEIPDWQRQEVWPRAKKQELIDSILRGWKLPKFYFVRTSTEPEEFEVVDGQQRLTTILEFFDNELATIGKLGRKSLHYSELPSEASDAFDDFEIEYDEISEASETDVKLYFQRLQQGLPLTSSEKLNAVHSSLRNYCRELARHNFFASKVSFANKRYAHFDVASKVDLIKPTNKTLAAVRTFGSPIRDFKGYTDLVSALYFVFWEGTGERLKGAIPPSFADINTLRTDLQHDLDHGKSKKAASKRRKSSATFRKYANSSTPQTSAPDNFPLLQVGLMNHIEGDLRTLLLSFT